MGEKTEKQMTADLLSIINNLLLIYNNTKYYLFASTKCTTGEYFLCLILLSTIKCLEQ